MTATLRSVLVLLVGIFLLMAGSGPLTTLLGVRLEATAAPTAAIGAVMAANFAGLTLGSLFAYRVILRAGHIRAFTAFASILSATALVYPIHLDFGLWGTLRLIEGFCMAGVYVCIESWLNDCATSETRGKILALYMSSLYFGQASGQLLLTAEDRSGFLLFVLISILLSVALVPVALTRTAPPALPAIASLNLPRLYRASPLGIVGTAAAGLILGSLYSLGPVFAGGIGLGLSETAGFMSAAIFGGVLLQWPLGRLSDLLDRRQVIVGAFAASILTSLGVIGAAPLHGAATLAAAALFGGTVFAFYPLCVAHTNDHLDRSERIAASGGLVLVYSAGATAGPLIASALMTAAGPNGLFAYVAAVAALGAGFGLWRMRVRPPVPSERQEAYKALPQTTPVAAPLDPRADG